MNPDELREFQAPLRTRSRDDPETAAVILRAGVGSDSPGVVCKVDTGRALADVCRRTT